MLLFSRISQNYFYIGKVKDRVYGLRDHGWLSVHGGLMTMGRHGRSGVQEIIMIARREREREEEVVGVLINCAAWSRSYRDSHMTSLNRGGWWCFDEEMVPNMSRRDWSRDGCSG
jgi:hypothetical protein